MEGTVSDATSPVTVRVNEVEATIGAGTYKAAAVDLPIEGPVLLRARATDAAGNSTVRSVAVVRDTLPPSLSHFPLTQLVPGTKQPVTVRPY